MPGITLLAGAGVATAGGETAWSLNVAGNFSFGDKTIFELEPFVQTDFQSASLGATFNLGVGNSTIGGYVGGVIPGRTNTFWGLQYTHGFDVKKITLSPQVTLDWSYSQNDMEEQGHCTNDSNGIFSTDVSQGGCYTRPLPKAGGHIVSQGGYTVGNSASLLVGIPLSNIVGLELAVGAGLTYTNPIQPFGMINANVEISLK